MKIEEIWRAWKVDPTLKNYLIFFIPPRQLFYRAYETDAEALSFILWFKVVPQWTTKYAWFPRESWKKYFSLLKEAGYSFIVVQDKEWNWSWKPIIKNDWNKSLDIKIPVSTINDFKRELNILITKENYENSSSDILFKDFYQTLNEIEELIKKYKLIPNILTPHIVSDKVPSLDFSDVKSDIDNLDDNISLDFQEENNNQ